MQTWFQFFGNPLLLRRLNSTPLTSLLYIKEYLHFSVRLAISSPLPPPKKTVKGNPYPKPQSFRASETCQHIRSKTISHSFQGYIPSSTRKFCTMHIYGEEAGEKIPIKSLPQELQKFGLKPSISSVYIF